MRDDEPGYTRRAKDDDFEYFDTEGKLIRDEQRLLRVKVWPFRPLTPAFGFVRRPTVTFRRRGAMPVGASNTVITSAGARCGTKTNTIA